MLKYPFSEPNTTFRIAYVILQTKRSWFFSRRVVCTSHYRHRTLPFFSNKTHFAAVRCNVFIIHIDFKKILICPTLDPFSFLNI